MMLATPIGKAPENTQKHSVAYRIYSHIKIKKKNPVPSVNSDSMEKCVLESHALMVGEGECLYISEILELLLFVFLTPIFIRNSPPSKFM